MVEALLRTRARELVAALAAMLRAAAACYSRGPAMKKTVREVAEELAKAHKLDDTSTTAVYFEDGVDNEVRLVEVSGSLSNGGPGEVLPFRFTPGEGVPFPSVVVLLSPSEWRALENDDLKLPEGWNKANLKKVG
ncbi:MAG: hypothetical protein ACLQVI_22630 [Polyangiaceae bacterium]